MKEKIIETSLQEFLTHGIRQITMQKLVVSLGISTKTMYKYFSNKEELLEECLIIHYKETDKKLLEIKNSSPNMVIALYAVFAKSIDLDFGTNHLFYHDLNYYYPELQDKAIKLYSSKAGEIFNGIIEKGILDGDFQGHLKAPIILAAISVLYTSVTRNEAYKMFKVKPSELMKHTIDVYLRGICTDKGLLIFNQHRNSI